MPKKAAIRRANRAEPAARIVVTGVCGFVGSHLAEALVRRAGAHVLGVDRIGTRDDPRTAAALTDLTTRPGFRLLTADVGDDVVAMALSEADAVVHLAAPTDVAASWGTGFMEQTASLLGTHRLLAACWEAQVPRMVVASSAHVYGPIDGPAREDVPAEPTSPYGVTKLAVERLAAAYARRPDSPMSSVALRFFTAFGPRVNPAMVVPRMFRSAQSGEPMRLFGDGDAAHSWTHVDDLVAAVLCALDLPVEPGHAETFNVAGRDTASLRQVGDLVGRIIGRPVKWEPARKRPGDAAGICADLTRARNVLGFSPRIGLDEGLKSLGEHLQTQDRPHATASQRTDLLA